MSWPDDEAEANSLFEGDDYFRNYFMSKMFEGESRNSIDRFDPNSPEAKSYLDLARRKPPSEDIYSKYLGSRPREADFEPSFGKKVKAGLYGALGSFATGDPKYGVALAEKRRREPFKRATDEWKAQGIGLGTRAHLADTAQGRELAVSKGILSNTERQRKEDRLTAGLEERKRSNAEKEDLARIKEKEREEAARKLEERRLGIDEARTRNEARQISANERAEKATARAEGKYSLKEKEQKALTAKVKARTSIKEANPSWFNDPADPKDFSLKSDLPSNELERARRRIKESEDFYRRKLGLPESTDEEY